MRLASAEKTHFPESDVYDIVSANLRDLFVHCCDADESVRIAANHLVSNYGLGGLRFVHRLIAEAMLGRMGRPAARVHGNQRRGLEPGNGVHIPSCLRSVHSDEASASEVGVPAGQSPPESGVIAGPITERPVF